VSGFGNLGDSPYRSWPAYAMVPEAMSGLYEYAPRGRAAPGHPAGALGDISSALFAVIGILAALRHRESTGRGQQVDVAMLDSMIAMTDVITNFWSLGSGTTHRRSS
jgi:crotonobetainyl-CoA:carnitine CoA-transferase CaiB-like acyl-CoA transferase